MKQNIPCEMIQDLLPLYVDGLTSDESSRQIEAHLETCGDCRSRYQRMKEDLERETQVKQKENEREIDYLKKIRKSSSRNPAGPVPEIVCHRISGGFLPCDVCQCKREHAVGWGNLIRFLPGIPAV